MTSGASISFISYCPCCGSKNIATRDSILSPFFAFRALGLEPVCIDQGEFRDLQAGMSYQPCKSIYCLSCASVACSARLSPSALRSYYSGYQDDEFIAMRIRFEPSFAERLTARSNPNTLRRRGELVSYLPDVEEHYLRAVNGIEPLTVLDFGGGSGANSPFKSNARVDIIDIDQDSPVATNLEQSYDLISILNVLEHVNSPLQTLRKAARYASPDTKILIEVPLERFMHDLTSTSYSTKKIWTEHINCFSAKGLERLVLNAGLRPVGDKPVTQFETSEAYSEGSGENNQALLVVASVS